MATTYILDMDCEEQPNVSSGNKKKGKTKAVASANPKQVRARARRRRLAADEAMELLYKPIEEWDEEELAHGRPRNENGSFAGKMPQWMNRKIHEEAMKRFSTVVKTKMNTQTLSALEVVQSVLNNDRTDAKGKPLVSANVKIDAAKFLIEHVIGKPTVRQETDISVRLQGVLAAAIMQPGPDGGGENFSVSHAITSGSLPTLGGPGVVDADSWEDDDDDYD